MARIADQTESAADLWAAKDYHAHLDQHDLEASDDLPQIVADPRKQALRNSLSEHDDNVEDNPSNHHSTTSRSRTPRKPLTSDSSRWYDVGPDSPSVRIQPTMESPKKGKFGDFEFELENPTTIKPKDRQRYAANDNPFSTDEPKRRVESTTARTSDSSTAVRRSASPSKTLTRPQPFNLASSKRETKVPQQTAEVPRRYRTSAGSSLLEQPKELTARPSARPVQRQQAHRAELPSSDEGLENPFKSRKFASFENDHTSSSIESSRALPKNQDGPKIGSLSPTSSPSRKPINLLTLKPSPGKAKRGMFRHDDGDDDSSPSSDPVSEALGDEDDDYLLTRRPLPTSSSRRRISSSFRDNKTKAERKPEPTSRPVAPASDIRPTLSAETSDALASLEASLARLKAPSQRRTANTEDNVHVSPPKRTLGDTRPRALSPSKAHNSQAPTRSVPRSDPTTAAASQTEEHDGFKKPTSASTFVAKSKLFLKQQEQRKQQEEEQRHREKAADGSNKERGREPGKEPDEPQKAQGVPRREEAASMGPPSLPVARSNDQDAAVAAAEARRKAALKAARRKSMHSILSFGGGLPSSVVKAEPDEESALADSSVASNAGDTSKTAEETRKLSRSARRRSMFTYVPTKREDADVGDRSVGNVSSGLIIGSAANAVPDDDASVPMTRKEIAATRYLRGLTVLVDVRDQDGEDASARWIEMLKNAGARTMVRFGERQLTHIVYKSGKPSTLHSYRALPDPKPLVVGVSWIVKCLEEGRRVDEEPYIVEVGKEAIFQKVS